MARKAPATTRAVLASAAPIDLADAKAALKARQRQRGADWQKDAWAYYDQIGEIKFVMNFIGDCLSKITLHAAMLDPAKPAETPQPVEDSAIADILDRLRGPLGSHAHLLRELGIHLNVTGECYLVGLESRSEEEPESWAIRSTEEFQVEGANRWTLETATGKRTLDPARDFAMRIWRPHPRKSWEADSGLLGILPVCEELQRLDRAFAAAEMNRAVQNGILFIPSEMSFGLVDPTHDPGDGEAVKDPYMRDLTQALVTAIQTPGTAAAAVPYIIRGAAEHGAAIQWIEIGRPLEEIFSRNHDRALKRLEQGLPIPVGTIEGMKDVNHWGSWQIEESLFKSHIEPQVIDIVGSLTEGYFRPALAKAQVANPERYVVWYDAARLIARPNRQDDAKWAHEKIIISDEAARRELDFDDADQPDEEEIARRIIQTRGLIDPALVGQVLGDLDPRAYPNGATPAPNGNGNGSAPPEEVAARVAAATQLGKPPANLRRNLGWSLAEIDRALRDRLQVAADLALRRALERAGNRVASAAKKKDRSVNEVIQFGARTQVCAMLGPSIVGAMGLTPDELLEGAFLDLGTRYESWVRKAQRMALGVIGIDDSDDGWDALIAAQDADRHEAWAWTLAALVALAHERLYDPSPAPPEFGEIDEGTLVPYGVLRASVARAGGNTAEPVTIGPVGGIGSGRLVLDALQERGGAIEAYEWVYGVYPRDRPFEPHERLNGLVFTNFDDERLTNTEGWPPTDYYTPGDHPGCVCDQVAVILAPDEVAEVLEASAR